MKKNDRLLFEKIPEEGIEKETLKCPICGEVFTRLIEKKSTSSLKEEYEAWGNKKYCEEFHYVSSYSLSHLFEQIRVNRRFTEKEFSEKIGYPEIYIKSVERGERIPSLKFSLLCAQEFGINPKWVKNKWVKEMTSWFEEKLITRLNLREEI